MLSLIFIIPYFSLPPLSTLIGPSIITLLFFPSSSMFFSLIFPLSPPFSSSSFPAPQLALQLLLYFTSLLLSPPSQPSHPPCNINKNNNRNNTLLSSSLPLTLSPTLPPVSNGLTEDAFSYTTICLSNPLGCWSEGQSFQFHH